MEILLLTVVVVVVCETHATRCFRDAQPGLRYLELGGIVHAVYVIGGIFRLLSRGEHVGKANERWCLVQLT